VVSTTDRHPTRKIDRSAIPNCVRGYGRIPLVFIDRGVKINAEYYKTEVLVRILLPEAQTLHGDEYYCFQQDGATSHIANIVQRWCVDFFTDFIPKDEWPPSSPDLNLLNFYIWGYMLGQLRNYKYATLPEFKKVIQRIWVKIPEHVVRATCDAFDKRFRLVIKE
jgi:transposase InsO family protein